MKIKKVEIQAFKSYVEKSNGTFDFTMQDNSIAKISCIYAPNGFGKTSFYDAVDYGITKNITRYIRNQSTRIFNGKIADAVGKFSREHASPQSQYVLRSRNAPENMETSISIETTIGDFREKINKPKRNSKDYQFDDTKTPKQRLFFREVMLSQEAIDSFLREDKAELRYSQFMDFQPQEVKTLENERQVISKISNEIGKVEKSIISDIEVIEDEISSFVISDELIAKSDSMYSELRSRGYSIPEVNSEFDEIQKNDKITISLLEKTKIKNKINSIDFNLEELYTNLSNLEKNISNIKIEIELNEKIKYNKEKIRKTDRYRCLNKDINEVNRNKTITSKALKELQDRLEESKKFRDILLRKINEQSINRIAELEIKNKIEIVSKEKIKKEQLSIQLKQNRDFIAKISDSLAQVDNDYEKLKDNNKLINSYLIRKDNNEKILESLKTEISKLDNLYNELESIDFNDISWIYKYPNIEESINTTAKEVSTTLKSIEEKEYSLRDNNHILSQYATKDNAISKLISDSLTFLGLIENKDSHQCPVCLHPYINHKELCLTISNNNLLDEKSRALKVKSISLENDISDLSKNYKNLVAKAKKNIENNIHNINLDRYELSDKKKKIEDDLDSIGKNIDKSREVINYITEKTNGLDKHNLVDLYERDKVIHEESQQLVVDKINEIDRIISDENHEIINLKNNLSTNEKINISEEDDFYSEYYHFLTINNIDFDSRDAQFSFKKINASLLERITIVEKELEIINNKNISILEELSEIRSIYHDISIDKLELINTSALEEIRNLTTSYSKVKDGNKDFFEFFIKNGVSSLILEGNNTEINDFITKSINALHKDKLRLETDLSDINIFIQLINELYSSFSRTKLKSSLIELNSKLIETNKYKKLLEDDLVYIISLLKELVDGYFYTELINKIYEKVDPHPEFKEIKFECYFPESSNPQLNVFVLKEGSTDFISPNLSFSSAQVSVLSLSIFLARAINNKGMSGKPCECILIDDPVQSMDSINILSTIDLLRNISTNLDRQIIISTHDENFFELMKLKLPSESSKFLKLSSYGKVESEPYSI